MTLTDKKGVRVVVPVNVGAAGAMFFVAHEDDDLLFLNPDIDAAFAAGKYVTTVYLTAGSCTGDVGEGAYYLTREAGDLEAYAHLAGVANEWTVTTQPIRELRLTAQPASRWSSSGSPPRSRKRATSAISRPRTCGASGTTAWQSRPWP